MLAKKKKIEKNSPQAMDPLITHLVERARNNDPRLRHVSLRSLPLLEVTHEEMYAVVESLQYNTHVNTFDMSLHYDESYEPILFSPPPAAKRRVAKKRALLWEAN